MEIFLADVEQIIEDISEKSQDIVRAKVTNVVTNYLNKPETNDKLFLNKTFNKTKAFLKDHPELLILQADKGGCTVAMDKATYIEKANILLEDNSTYKILKQDPTTTIQTKYNELIKQLERNREIDKNLFDHLTIYNSSCPKLYCLPKIHKQGVPLRPLVSCINSTTYNISKHLSEILSEAFEDETNYNIKDTFTFVNEMRGRDIPKDYILISLDVVSLFTNIPITLIIEIVKKEWDRIKTYTSISKNSFLKLLTFIFTNTYFSFNGQYYQQTQGTPMGSPISPIIAIIVLDYLLDTVIPKLPFNLPFLYKYMDDLICAVPADNIDITLNIFNSFNSHLQFTIEIENDASIAFLDTRVIRTESNKLILDWHEKPTASGRFLNYHSNHPSNQKFNTVRNMKNRIIHISNDIFLKKNLDRLFKIFVNNGYPKHILKKLIYSSHFYDGAVDVVVEDVKYRRLPYINGLTQSIIKLVKEHTNTKIAKYSIKNNNSLFSKNKDKTPKPFLTDVIYEIPCEDCDACYIGQTSQWLKARLTQHKSDCKTKKNRSALSQHHESTGHNFNYDETKIIDKMHNYKSRLFLEMYYIYKNNNTVNHKTDTNQLSNIYSDILNRI